MSAYDNNNFHLFRMLNSINNERGIQSTSYAEKIDIIYMVMKYMYIGGMVNSVDKTTSHDGKLI